MIKHTYKVYVFPLILQIAARICCNDYPYFINKCLFYKLSKFSAELSDAI